LRHQEQVPKALSFELFSRQALAISFSSRTKAWYDCLNRLLAFQSGIGLAPNVGRGATTTALVEEAREERLKERSEDDLGAVGHGKGHPQD